MRFTFIELKNGILLRTQRTNVFVKLVVKEYKPKRVPNDYNRCQNGRKHGSFYQFLLKNKQKRNMTVLPHVEFSDFFFSETKIQLNFRLFHLLSPTKTDFKQQKKIPHLVEKSETNELVELISQT